MAVGLSIEVRGLGSTQATLENIPDQAGRAVMRSNAIAGHQIKKFWQLQLRGPAGPRRLSVQSGRLLRSIQVGKRGDGVVVGTDAPYARIHEFGGHTKPHVIEPRVAKALRFRGRDGNWQIRKKVNHPGSKIPARPHRAPAVKSVWPVLVELYEGNVEKALQTSLAIGKRLGRAADQRLAQAQRRGLTGRRGR